MVLAGGALPACQHRRTRGDGDALGDTRPAAGLMEGMADLDTCVEDARHRGTGLCVVGVARVASRDQQELQRERRLGITDGDSEGLLGATVCAEV